MPSVFSDLGNGKDMEAYSEEDFIELVFDTLTGLTSPEYCEKIKDIFYDGESLISLIKYCVGMQPGCSVIFRDVLYKYGMDKFSYYITQDTDNGVLGIFDPKKCGNASAAGQVADSNETKESDELAETARCCYIWEKGPYEGEQCENNVCKHSITGNYCARHVTICEPQTRRA
jgi:hypothetical protein